jgi:hypothetical protein
MYCTLNENIYFIKWQQYNIHALADQPLFPTAMSCDEFERSSVVAQSVSDIDRTTCNNTIIGKYASKYTTVALQANTSRVPRKKLIQKFLAG